MVNSQNAGISEAFYLRFYSGNTYQIGALSLVLRKTKFFQLSHYLQARKEIPKSQVLLPGTSVLRSAQFVMHWGLQTARELWAKQFWPASTQRVKGCCSCCIFLLFLLHLSSQASSSSAAQHTSYQAPPHSSGMLPTVKLMLLNTRPLFAVWR